MQSPSGRQWFPLYTRAPDERWTGAVSARPALDAFLDAELHGWLPLPAVLIWCLFRGVKFGPETLPVESNV